MKGCFCSKWQRAEGKEFLKRFSLISIVKVIFLGSANLIVLVTRSGKAMQEARVPTDSCTSKEVLTKVS